MAMGSTGSGEGLSSDINVTPLIDVLLVLLIIFMITQPLSRKAFDVQVPPEQQQKSKQQPSAQIVLELLPDGGYAINKQSYSKDQLGPTLQQLYENRPAKLMFINAAPNPVAGGAGGPGAIGRSSTSSRCRLERHRRPWTSRRRPASASPRCPRSSKSGSTCRASRPRNPTSWRASGAWPPRWSAEGRGRARAVARGPASAREPAGRRGLERATKAVTFSSPRRGRPSCLRCPRCPAPWPAGPTESCSGWRPTGG